MHFLQNTNYTSVLQHTLQNQKRDREDNTSRFIWLRTENINKNIISKQQPPNGREAAGKGQLPGTQQTLSSGSPSRPPLPPGSQPRSRFRRSPKQKAGAAGFAIRRLLPAWGSTVRGERGRPPPRQPSRFLHSRPQPHSSRTKAPAANPASLCPPQPSGPLPGRRCRNGRARPGSGSRSALAWTPAERVGPEPTWSGRAEAEQAERLVPGDRAGRSRPQDSVSSSPRLRAPARRASRAPSPIRRATLRAVPQPEQPKLERRQAAPAERRAVAVLGDDRSGATRAGEMNRARRVAGLGAASGPASSPRRLVRGAPYRGCGWRPRRTASGARARLCQASDQGKNYGVPAGPRPAPAKPFGTVSACV